MWKLLVASLVTTAVLALPGGELKKGDKVPAGKFNDVIWNWDGAEGVQDYLGEPVLVDYWGRHCGPCVGEAVPHAIKLQTKYADQGLHTVLVHSQDGTREEVVAFTIQTFPTCTTTAVLSQNSPFQIAGNGLPKQAVIGVDGSVVWTSNDPGTLDKAIEAELEKLHLIRDLDKALAPVTKDLKARNFGKAVTTLRGIAAKASDSPKVKADADAMIEHLEATVANKFAMAKRLTEAGRPVRAKQQLAVLAKQVAGDKTWSDQVAAAMKMVDAMKDDVVADKLMVAAEDLLKERKCCEEASVKFGELSKKYPNAKVAKLAGDLQKAALDKSVEK